MHLLTHHITVFRGLCQSFLRPMYKRLFLICVFLLLTLTSTHFATADYRITNGSATEPAWVVYSAWRPASGGWPVDWRTRGYYKVEPGGTQNLFVPENNETVYIYAERASGEIKPPDHATGDSRALRGVFYERRITMNLALQCVRGDENSHLLAIYKRRECYA